MPSASSPANSSLLPRASLPGTGSPAGSPRRTPPASRKQHTARYSGGYSTACMAAPAAFASSLWAAPPLVAAPNCSQQHIILGAILFDIIALQYQRLDLVPDQRNSISSTFATMLRFFGLRSVDS